MLGPLLFLLFINDIVDGIPVKIKLYADDCVLYREICCPADQHVLNIALQKVSSWCDDWQMAINFEKTVFMQITNKRNPLKYEYSTNHTKLSEVPHYKYLGLWITNDLNWTKHINMVTNTAMHKLFFLRRALKLSTPSVRLLAYKTIVIPTLDYASIIWDPFTKTNINKLERVQKKAIRFIYNSFGRTSITELSNRANLPTLTERNRLSRLKFLYQLVKGHYKTDISEVLSFSSGYATRQRHERTITPYATRNNCFKYSFFPRTINDWNKLTNTEVLQPSLTLFSSSLNNTV